MRSTVVIEFGLPNGAGGMAAAHSAGTLKPLIKEWAQLHNRQVIIGINSHTHRRWLTVKFEQESDLTLFALSWDADSFMGWQRVQELF